MFAAVSGLGLSGIIVCCRKLGNEAGTRGVDRILETVLGAVESSDRHLGTRRAFFANGKANRS